MIKTLKTLFILFTLFTLCSCSIDSSIVYEGESSHWSSTYTIRNPTGEYHTESLKINYKGRNLKDIKQIKYKYDTGGTGGGSGTLEKMPVYGIISTGIGGNGALPSKDSIIHVTIEWNGNKEELELTSK